jgi:hypothetical protein
VAIFPSFRSGKKDKKEMKPLGPLWGPLIKSFVNEAVDLFTSEKLEKSSGGILRLYLLTFIVSFRKSWLFK